MSHICQLTGLPLSRVAGQKRKRDSSLETHVIGDHYNPLALAHVFVNVYKPSCTKCRDPLTGLKLNKNALLEQLTVNLHIHIQNLASEKQHDINMDTDAVYANELLRLLELELKLKLKQSTTQLKPKTDFTHHDQPRTTLVLALRRHIRDTLDVAIVKCSIEGVRHLDAPRTISNLPYPCGARLAFRALQWSLEILMYLAPLEGLGACDEIDIAATDATRLVANPTHIPSDDDMLFDEIAIHELTSALGRLVSVARHPFNPTQSTTETISILHVRWDISVQQQEQEREPRFSLSQHDIPVDVDVGVGDGAGEQEQAENLATQTTRTVEMLLSLDTTAEVRETAHTLAALLVRMQALVEDTDVTGPGIIALQEEGAALLHLAAHAIPTFIQHDSQAQSISMGDGENVAVSTSTSTEVFNDTTVIVTVTRNDTLTDTDTDTDEYDLDNDNVIHLDDQDDDDTDVNDEDEEENEFE